MKNEEDLGRKEEKDVDPTTGEACDDISDPVRKSLCKVCNMPGTRRSAVLPETRAASAMQIRYNRLQVRFITSKSLRVAYGIRLTSAT